MPAYFTKFIGLIVKKPQKCEFSSKNIEIYFMVSVWEKEHWKSKTNDKTTTNFNFKRLYENNVKLIPSQKFQNDQKKNKTFPKTRIKRTIL